MKRLTGVISVVLAILAVAACGDANEVEEQRESIIDVEPVQLIPMAATSAETEVANKKLVLDFWRDFFNYRLFDEGITAYIAPDFTNHDPYEPSDPQAFADVVRSHLGKIPAIPEKAKMFIIAEGDLVLIAEMGDMSQTEFSANLVRVDNNKMIEMWYSGGAIAGAEIENPFDKSRENFKPGPADIIGRKVLVPMTPTSTDQERANKKLVLDFWRDFHNRKLFEQAAGNYLAADFMEHYPAAPSGAVEYAAFYKAGDHSLTTDESEMLFVLAEGDLVALSEASDDGEASFDIHLYRVHDGRITDHWYSGPKEAQAPPGTNFEKVDESDNSEES